MVELFILLPGFPVRKLVVEHFLGVVEKLTISGVHVG
jgi:hypothetical protein